MNILITGATGFVGAELVKELVKEGNHLFILARSQSKVDKLLKELDNPEKITVVLGELSMPHLGLDETSLKNLKGRIDVVYHMAALLSFDPKDKEKTFEVNYVGTQNVLKLSEFLEIKRFIFVSTAYTLGNQVEANEKLHDSNREFVNYYEESKCLAEHEVFKYTNIFETIIMRPAIIVGNSKTGEANSTFALYGVLKALKLFQRKFGDNTNIFRLFIDQETRSNFVPVDYVVDVLLLGKDIAEPGKIYHITNSNPLSHGTIFQLIVKNLGIKNIELMSTSTVDSIRKSKEELFLNAPLSIFNKYCNRTIKFIDENTKNLLKQVNKNELNFTEDVMETIIKGYVQSSVKL